MQHRPAEEAGYQDPLIRIQDGTLAIRRYYFPTGTKRIRLAAISRVEEYPMGKTTGRWRTWGSGDLVHWLNLDPRRRHKQQAVIDLGRDQDPDGVSSCGDLFVTDADGSHLARLTSGPASDCGPSFTPDGRHVLFFSDRAHPGGDSDLYVMNPDGSAVTRLTHATSEEQEPAFTSCKGTCP